MEHGHVKGKEKPWRIYILGFSGIIIGICEVLLLMDVAAEKFDFGIPALLADQGNIEPTIIVALGLALATIGINLRDLLRENGIYKAMVKAASGQLVGVIYSKFNDWDMTESEQEVAFMLIKGFSVQEIGEFRNTRPGTIKSQCNSIYRKANVHGRNELIAYFVEDLLAGENLILASANGDGISRTIANRLK